jgi:hypothetical protein
MRQASRREGKPNGPKRDSPAQESPTDPVPVSRPASDAPLSEWKKYFERGVVRIDAYDHWNVRKGLGSGVLIDAKEMLVTTNFHVAREAIKADAEFFDGTRYGVLGYAAVDETCDLALFRLNGLPPSAVALDLKLEGPEELEEVIALGNPLGAKFFFTTGTIAKVANLSHLSIPAQEFLREGGVDRPENVWIAHQAAIAPGNSGGPVLTPRGEVVGINTWIEDAGFGYAIHARHVDKLRRQALPASEPLTKHYRPASPRLQPPPVGYMQDLCDEFLQRDWSTALVKDFDALNRLTLLLNASMFGGVRPTAADGDAQQPLAEFLAESDRVMDQLSNFDWHSQRHVQPLNKHARAAAGDEEAVGLVFFCLVEQVLERQGHRALLLRLEGLEDRYFLPLELQPEGLEAGSACLVLGYGQNAHFSYSVEGQPPVDVPVVRSMIVLLRRATAP